MPVPARRLVRKMRGGAQAHLLEAEDGNFYVVKFKNNPQHRRILANELIASVFLRYLQISTPDTAIIEVTSDFLAENPEVRMQLGNRPLPVEPGWHFGSKFPGHPERVAVYDFIPDALLKRVANLSEFLGVLVFDKWIGNADSRQSVFFRARLAKPEMVDEPGLRLGFCSLMLDHGYIFNGPHWEFMDSPLSGLYFRPVVYETVRSVADFEPWLERVMHFPEEIVDEALRQVPPEWISGTAGELEQVLAKLLRRRKRVPDLIAECKTGRINPFPNWS